MMCCIVFYNQEWVRLVREKRAATVCAYSRLCEQSAKFHADFNKLKCLSIKLLKIAKSILTFS